MTCLRLTRVTLRFHFMISKVYGRFVYTKKSGPPLTSTFTAFLEEKRTKCGIIVIIYKLINFTKMLWVPPWFPLVFVQKIQ